MSTDKSFILLYFTAWAVVLCTALSALHFVSCGVTTGAFLTPADRQRLKQVFINALGSGDVAAIHYATLGLGLLSEKVPNPQVITCTHSSLVVAAVYITQSLFLAQHIYLYILG